MTTDANNLYPAKYGSWEGHPAGQKPDHSRCCKEVAEPGRWTRFHQCSRPRGHGPDGAYCKQHDPAIVERRRAALAEKNNIKHNAHRYQWHGRQFFDALEKIAAGHNDPRSLAIEVIAEFKEGER